MRVFNIRKMDASTVYEEFLRVPALSLGVYNHAAGMEVPQVPHTEDEIYFVISGRGVIEVDGVDHEVTEGSTVYVPAGVPHHFHGVTEKLRVLVLFAPAEGTAAS